MSTKEKYLRGKEELCEVPTYKYLRGKEEKLCAVPSYEKYLRGK